MAECWRSLIRNPMGPPAQVPILLTVNISGPEYLFYEPIETCQKRYLRKTLRK